MVTTHEKVRLVPYDSASEAHAERMYLQRVACGWSEDEVAAWRGHCESGRKGIWWLVLEEGISDREKMMEDHLARNPDEKDPLSDTSTSIFRTTRNPTNEAFIPVGHVSLEWKPEVNRQLDLPTDGVIWATTLYISFPLRGYGLGRSTMRQVEATALRAPVSARVMALDTQKGASQMSKEVVKLMYEDRGLPTPSVIKTNEDWYRRQGYHVFGEEEKAYGWQDSVAGEMRYLPRVFLKKELV